MSNVINQIDITTDFTDPDFLAAVYEIIEKPTTEPIYKSDVEAIDMLEIEGRDIKSLNGLEHFSAITLLNCSNNCLTALPELPSGLLVFFCGNNQLTKLLSISRNWSTRPRKTVHSSVNFGPQ